MTAQMQNPGVQAGASRNQLGGWLHFTSPYIASDWRAQILASHFCLSPRVTRDMTRLCFGEGCHD